MVFGRWLNANATFSARGCKYNTIAMAPMGVFWGYGSNQKAGQGYGDDKKNNNLSINTIYYILYTIYLYLDFLDLIFTICVGVFGAMLPLEIFWVMVVIDQLTIRLLTTRHPSRDRAYH